jgi:hypothetical protein
MGALIKASEVEWLSSRQVAQRIRRGKLPERSAGQVRCVCHPDKPQAAVTESLRFWGRGDHVACGDRTNAKAHPRGVPALAFYPELRIAIDTRK